MQGTSPAEDSAGRRIVLIGHNDLAEVTRRALDAAGARVTQLRDPVDREIREALDRGVESVLVISNDDNVALRLALVVEGVRPGVPLIVTIFARGVASQLARAVRNLRVISMGDIVAPTLVAPCLDERVLSVTRTPDGFGAVRVVDGQPRHGPLDVSAAGLRERMVANVGSLVSPFDLSARILMAGLLGLLFVLVVDTVATALVFDQSAVDSLYSATKTIVTVGPNPHVDSGPEWFKVFSSVAFLAALVFTAIFTAGVVDRLLDRRLTAIAGRRAVPRRHHVVVVGLGQVGLRVCLLLQDLGIPVLAVEQEPHAPTVRRAKDYKVPVVIGRGSSRFLLRRLSLSRARALAAVTSDEVENIAIVVAALGVHEDLRTVLRAGRGEVTNETRALLAIGVTRDTYRIGGTLLAAAALGFEGREAFLHEQTVYLVAPDGEIAPFEAGADGGDRT